MNLNHKRQRILFTGGASLLAYLWANGRDNQNDILLLEHQRKITKGSWPIKRFALDDSGKLAEFMDEQEVDIVVNTAALTNVEQCEKEPDLAAYVNTKLSGIISKTCFNLGIKLIHVSTDHLYGLEQSCFTEDNSTALLNVYSRTKFAGEEEVLAANPSALVCRTNFFGNGPTYRPSFSDKIIKSLQEKADITLFTDVVFSPLLGLKLAEYAHKLSAYGCCGIYNISSDDCMSKYDFGLLLARCKGLSTEHIKAGTFAARRDLVKRPTAMVLSNKKAAEVLGHPLGTISEHIQLL